MARQAATCGILCASSHLLNPLCKQQQPAHKRGHVAGVERQAGALLKPQPAHMPFRRQEILPSLDRGRIHPLPAQFVTAMATLTPLHTCVCAVVTVTRYLMSTDGWSATSKLDKYLLLGSVVLKQESPKYGWFYKALQPMENYVPFFKEAPDDVLKVTICTAYYAVVLVVVHRGALWARVLEPIQSPAGAHPRLFPTPNLRLPQSPILASLTPPPSPCLNPPYLSPSIAHPDLPHTPTLASLKNPPSSPVPTPQSRSPPTQQKLSKHAPHSMTLSTLHPWWWWCCGCM